MDYIAAIDYEHLDNGVFLTSLAQSLSKQQGQEDMRSILIHSDSDYTERVIQTGVMREEARKRSVKDLNKRLITLLADEGVSAMGINPFQRKVISSKNGKLSLDHVFLDSLPRQSVLVLSTLVHDANQQETDLIPLPRLMKFLTSELDVDERFIFSKSDEAEVFTGSMELQQIGWNNIDTDFKDQQIPDEFSDFEETLRITTARDFTQLPNLENTIRLKSA